MRQWVIALFVWVLAGNPLALCQQKGSFAAQPSQEAPPVIRAVTNLVLARFHVIRKNHYVDDLRPEHIQILQDGRPQQLVILEGPLSDERTIPVELVVLLDVSFSVVKQGLLNGSLLQKTVIAGLDEHAKISIYGHARRVRRFCGPTRDLSVLKKALSDARQFAHGGTLLYKSIQEVCRNAAESSRNTLRVMIVFSDGFETAEGHPDDALEVAKEFDIKLYPVVLGHQRLLERARRRAGLAGGRTSRLPRPGRGDRVHWLERRMEQFADLGARTGGRSFDPLVLNVQTIGAILQIVVADVRSEYVAGYYAQPSLKKGKHKVKVVLVDKSLGKIKGGRKEFTH